MQKTHGIDFAKIAKRRCAQIIAMPNFSEYLALGLGNPHSLTGEFNGFYSVSIIGSKRLILEPICADLSAESLKVCNELILKGVVDYHGQKDEWIIP